MIGGTYFAGKSFLANIIDKLNNGSEKLGITVLNRGTKSLKEVLGQRYDVTLEKGNAEFCELHCDRTDEEALKSVLGGCDDAKTGKAEESAVPCIDAARFDAVVDFCAYNSGDIEKVFNALDTYPEQYIFLSTCDVYERGTGQTLDESSPFEERRFPGEAGAYITGKVALERELDRLCEKTQTAKTVLRPSVIFGEGNYAPREGMYFKWIEGAGQIIHPSDATGTCQLTYVGDVAEAISLCLFNEKAYGKAYNLIGTNPLTYDAFADLLESATGRKIERVLLSVSEITARGIPLPFPLYKEESEAYDGGLIKELGFDYSDAVKAMSNTWESCLNNAV